MTWSTGTPFGEQIQEVVESHDAVAVEVFIAASTGAPRSKNFKEVGKVNRSVVVQIFKAGGWCT
jgi:hypothetical protein